MENDRRKLIESVAIRLAEALHGGKWDTHYTEAQKDVWRVRAIPFLDRTW